MAALIPAVMALVLIAGFAITRSSLQELQRQEAAAIKVSNDLNELNDLARSYIDTHAERPRMQFSAKHAQLTDGLGSVELPARYEPELDRIARDVELIDDLFDRIVGNREHILSGDARALEAEERLAGQLFVRSRRASGDVADIVVLIGDDGVRQQRQIYLLNGVLAALMAGFLGFALFRLTHGIRVSVARLSAGTEIVGAGDFDYRIPLDMDDEFADLARSFNDMTARLQTEHDIAERLQGALLELPEQLAGVTFATVYRSASQSARVGGDFYDLFEMDGCRVGIIVGDVAGKGLNAAALTATVKDTIRAHALGVAASPAQTLQLTNELLFRSTPAESFVTVWFGVLDASTGELEYANAGHPPALLLRPDGSIAQADPTGSLLGAMDGIVIGPVGKLYLGADDMLILYTDGLIEARNGAEFFGEDRLAEAVRGLSGMAPDEGAAALVDRVLEFAGGSLLDDVAVLLVKRT